MPASAPESYVPYDLSVLRTYGDGFAGREAELAALDRAWTGGTRVFVLHAEGGAGKTRVVAWWLTRLCDAGWRGARRVFVHSFYSQGSDERRNASSELFFEQALSHFGYSGPRRTDPAEQGRTLARLVVEQHGLLVLDGLEPLQHPPAFDRGRLKDPALYSLLLSLAAGGIGHPACSEGGGLCVVTSRQPVVELQDKTGRTVVQQPLGRLDAAAGVELLRQLEVKGPEAELRQAVEDSHGHAYSLTLLGSYLRDATTDHEIRRRHEIPLLEEDSEHRYHARHLFSAYTRHLGESSPEVAVLRMLGFFDRPTEEKLLGVLRGAAEPELRILTAPLRDLSPADWHRVLRRLADLRLIDRPVSPSSPPLDSHALLREYFAEQLRTRFPGAWKAGHQRLFKYLCETAEDQPATLAGLQPLYQAVAHGCLGGSHQEACDGVYKRRILRGTDRSIGGFYSTRELGAIREDLGALANFFVVPWTTLAPNLKPPAQAWLRQEAAYRLSASGRLTEAAEPMRVGLDLAVEQNDWKHAAIYAGNLSALELKQGEVLAAVAAAEQAVKYAGRGGQDDREGFVRSRGALAGALHSAGRRAESRRWLEEAGLRQDGLLLSDAERAAWRACLFALPADSTGEVAACNAVLDGAFEPMAWDGLLGIALDHLTLGQALLYKAVLSALPIPPAARDHVNAAVNGLQAAATEDQLPKGLLTRAWLRHLSGDLPGCLEDLGEAREIAERGPMPLFQADIQLTRARLFHDRAALAEARSLIEKHGYHRRDEELADARAAAEGWDLASPDHSAGAEAKASAGSPPDRVFISYSHSDQQLLDELLAHLTPYVRAGHITVWWDQKISAGDKWLSEIQAELDRTSVAVLLVSPDFLASEFIHEHELGPLLQRAAAGGVKILWVQLRACSFEQTPLKDYQAVVSPPAKPLAQNRVADRAVMWVRVCDEIKRAVNR